MTQTHVDWNNRSKKCLWWCLMTPGLHESATHHAGNITCLVKDIRTYKKSLSNNIPPTMSSDTKKNTTAGRKKQSCLPYKMACFINFYFSISQQMHLWEYVYALLFLACLCQDTRGGDWHEQMSNLSWYMGPCCAATLSTTQCKATSKYKRAKANLKT